MPTSRMAFDCSDALFVEAIKQARRQLDQPILVGLCGSQGSGKSTTARRLVARLADLGLAGVACSLDDFYLTRSRRDELSRSVHPMLQVRGVPGTHDVELAAGTLNRLLDAGIDSAIPIPMFDKASDDRAPEHFWPVHHSGCDVIILEGWCVGTRPQPEEQLETPINGLESEHDPDCVWRRYVNERLATDYAALFDRLDLRLMLRAPSFDCVHAWRLEQELALGRTADTARPAMDAVGIANFIAHYERITRWLLKDEPAHLIADLGVDRAPLRWRRKVHE